MYRQYTLAWIITFRVYRLWFDLGARHRAWTSWFSIHHSVVLNSRSIYSPVTQICTIRWQTRLRVYIYNCIVGPRRILPLRCTVTLLANDVSSNKIIFKTIWYRKRKWLMWFASSSVVEEIVVGMGSSLIHIYESYNQFNLVSPDITSLESIMAYKNHKCMHLTVL